MANDRLTFALGRLERAISRIERNLADVPAHHPVTSGTDPALQERHDRLRGEVQSAIARIDALAKSMAS